eukprot:5710790-Lingulodinium_polyedra.AAC.1
MARSFVARCDVVDPTRRLAVKSGARAPAASLRPATSRLRAQRALSVGDAGTYAESAATNPPTRCRQI